MENFDDRDVSLGLSKSDVAYLNTNAQVDFEMNEVQQISDDRVDTDGGNYGTEMIESGVDASCGNNDGFVNEGISNNEYSGVLQPKMLPENSHHSPQISNRVSDQFVQVATQGSMDVVSPNVPQVLQMVSTPLSSDLAYTSTTPTVTTTVTDLGQLQYVYSANNEGMTTNTVTHLPLVVDNGIISGQDLNGETALCSINAEVQTGTTNAREMYVVALTVENDQLKVMKTDELTPSMVILPTIPEPQRASTPRMDSIDNPQLDVTIIAGNVDAEKLVEVDGNPDIKAEMKKEISNEETVKKTVKKELFPERHPCKQIQLCQNKQEKNKEDSMHNKTYCDDGLVKRLMLIPQILMSHLHKVMKVHLT